MSRQSGDTLVEVLIATAILSAAVVGGLGIMNFGFGIILNSIERTQAQAAVNSQVSLVRYARDAYVSAGRSIAGGGAPVVWQKIRDNASTTNSTNICADNGQALPASNAFYITLDGTPTVATYNTAPGSAVTAPVAGKGIWIEAVQDSPSSDYVNIYVKACWQPATGSVSEEAKTVLRLYAP